MRDAEISDIYRDAHIYIHIEVQIQNNIDMFAALSSM